MERVEFITHRGKQVLFINLAGCTPAEVMETCERVVDVVSSQPRGSVLLVADFTGAQLDREAVTLLKEGATRDKPFVRHAAWVGTSGIPETLMKSIVNFSTRKLTPFETVDQALDWIVTADDHAIASGQ